MLNVVVVMLSTITVYRLTEEWFMWFLYIVYHYCVRFDRVVVHVVVAILSTIAV